MASGPLPFFTSLSGVSQGLGGISGRCLPRTANLEEEEEEAGFPIL
jgi:hypothetical protein